MKKLFFLFGLTVFGLSSFSQDSTSSIVIHKDPRIDVLVKKQGQINEETTRDARRTMPGFRIQVINTNDRTAAINAKTRVYQLYPELKAYLLYQAPYFRLRVGNFRDREEAAEYMKSISKQFDNNVMLVRDVIEVKPDRLEQ